jgi:hypothetical protein
MPKKAKPSAEATRRAKGSRRKGQTYERENANRLKSVWPDAKRGIGQARSAKEVADVEGTPYWIEAKHHKRVNIRAAFNQGTEATDGRPVVVVSRDTNKPPDLVTMSFDEWLRLVAELAKLRKVVDDYLDKV